MTAYSGDSEITLNMEEFTDASYHKFITDLRSKLAKGDSQSGRVPILPNYGANSHLFDVLLTIENHRATACVQHDNLYVGAASFISQTNG